ncbi:hypothetical protein M427DRAFT_142949 [Gonapodya prolifera JEL478]|uniref:Phosducin domain-containing protein n=1 Tax=Gonapodya prolifera (strain JEL478) TaxID=1344416 RepID=A0A139ATV1_GONPJ|nr:hypothetical protein M427DRAFT_142949 [Gonapodya prolifera JEL478]|eukprot:KXS20170.1 hypothetical protein M427DRAFT_142949 [Gonapodya prolifera JEL478]
MTARQLKRKQQSEHDRKESLLKKGQELSDPLNSYRNLLGKGVQDNRASGHFPEEAEDVAPYWLSDVCIPLIRQFGRRNELVTEPLSHDEIEAVSFFRGFIKRSRITTATWILALYFIHRLQAMTKGRGLDQHDSIESALVPSLMCAVITADKILNDATWTQQDWTEYSLGRYSVLRLNELERSFLSRLDWSLFVSNVQMGEFLAYLEGLVQQHQLFLRWTTVDLTGFTYRDVINHSFFADVSRSISVTSGALMGAALLLSFAFAAGESRMDIPPNTDRVDTFVNTTKSALLERFERSQNGLDAEDAIEAREGGRNAPSSASVRGAGVDTEVTDTTLANILSDTALRQQIESGPQTGPKGVIADHRFHQKQERARAVQKEQELARAWRRTGMKSGWMQRQERREQQEKWGVPRSSGDDSDRSNSDSSDEDDRAPTSRSGGMGVEQLRSYLESAVSEGFDLFDKRGTVHFAEHARNFSISNDRKPKTFGLVTQITQDDYVAAVEHEPPQVTVVVHLFQRTHPLCVKVNSHLDKLAVKYARTKFLRIVSTDADPDFDEIALPAILAYRDGQLIANLIRVQDEVPGNGGTIELNDLENLLISNDVLRRDSGGMVQA